MGCANRAEEVGTAGRDDGGHSAGGWREGAVVAFGFVSNWDLSSSVSLGCEEEQAVRDVVDGAEGEAVHVLVLAVMMRARRDGLWLGCDCRSEDDRRPVE